MKSICSASRVLFFFVYENEEFDVRVVGRPMTRVRGSDVVAKIATHHSSAPTWHNF